MSITLNSLAKFDSFESCEITTPKGNCKIAEEKEKKFLCFKWKIKLMVAVNKKTNALELDYFSRFDCLLQKILPSRIFSHQIKKDRVWTVLKENAIVNKDEKLPADKKMRQVLAEKIRISLGNKGEQGSPTVPNSTVPNSTVPNSTTPNSTIRGQGSPTVPNSSVPPKIGTASSADALKLVDLLKQNSGVEIVKEVLDRIPDLNQILPGMKHTPLTLAIEQGNFEVAKYLIDLNTGKTPADVNKCTELGSPLGVAIIHDNTKPFIDFLLDKGAKPQNKSESKKLQEIAKGMGKDKLVEHLQKMKTNEVYSQDTKDQAKPQAYSSPVQPTRTTPVQPTTTTPVNKQMDPNLKDQFLKFLKGTKPHDQNALEAIVKNIPDLNVPLAPEVNTPLHLAILNNNVEAFNFLINLKDETGNPRVNMHLLTPKGESTLGLAANDNNTSEVIIRALIRAKVKPKDDQEHSSIANKLYSRKGSTLGSLMDKL